jgi:hypothetical protein
LSTEDRIAGNGGGTEESWPACIVDETVPQAASVSARVDSVEDGGWCLGGLSRRVADSGAGAADSSAASPVGMDILQRPP